MLQVIWHWAMMKPISECHFETKVAETVLTPVYDSTFHQIMNETKTFEKNSIPFRTRFFKKIYFNFQQTLEQKKRCTISVIQ